MEDISNLKVLELKEELKARGLSPSGTKAELQQRLIQAVSTNATDNNDAHSVSEHQILQTASDDEDDSVLEGAPEELILGIAEPTDSSENTILGNESAKLTYDRGVDPKSSEPSIPSSTGLPAVDISDPAAVATDQSNSEESTTVSGISDTKATVNTHPVIDSDEARQKRARRFSDDVPEDVKKSMRAERFGTVSKPVSITQSVSKDPEKLKQRAARFGLSSSALVTSLSDSEKRKVRAERFGVQVQNNNQDTTSRSPALDALDAIRKRAARFNTTEPSDVKKAKRAERFGTSLL